MRLGFALFLFVVFVVPDLLWWRWADRRVRERFSDEVATLKKAYGGILWAMERQFRKTNDSVSRQIHSLRKDLQHEFGLASRVVSNLLGPYLLWSARREERRLANGFTYEPPTFVERSNWPAP